MPKPAPIPPLAFLRAALKTSPQASDVDLVKSMVTVRAILAERTDVDHKFVADPANVGYLRRAADGVVVFVPFHLVSVFPGGDRLEPLVLVAKDIVLGGSHPICLSGSATFLGASVPISDLDFCEYFPSPIASMPPLIVQRVGTKIERLLVRVNWNGKRFKAPFSTLQHALDGLATEDVTYVKLDFVWSIPTFDIVPTTSMVLKTKEDFSGSALSRSHVHQEAVICRGDPPRSVFGISEISGYLDFLKKEVAKYSAIGMKDGSEASLKAMKRALSLLLLIGAEQDEYLHTELEGLIEDLVSPAVEGVVLKQRIDELVGLGKDADPGAQPALEREIEALKLRFQGSMLEDEERDLVLRGASQSAAALTDMIDELFLAANGSGH